MKFLKNYINEAKLVSKNDAFFKYYIGIKLENKKARNNLVILILVPIGLAIGLTKFSDNFWVKLFIWSSWIFFPAFVVDVWKIYLIYKDKLNLWQILPAVIVAGGFVFGGVFVATSLLERALTIGGLTIVGILFIIFKKNSMGKLDDLEN